jgi:hypothetical protein
MSEEALLPLSSVLCPLFPVAGRSPIRYPAKDASSHSVLRQFRVVRPRHPVRKLLCILGIAVLTPIGVLVGALALWWFTTDNNASINFNNHSGTTLRNVVITVPGGSARFETLGPQHEVAFSGDPRLRFDIHVAFDARDRHYDLPARTHVLPFGDSIVVISIDEQMRLAVGAKPTFMYR